MTDDPFADPDALIRRLDGEPLRRIVANAARLDRVEDVSYHLHRRIAGCQGYNGRKFVISASFRSATGYGHGWVDLLLKCPAKGCREHTLYPALMAQGAPVPRLEGMLRLDHEHPDRAQDLMVLEFLPHIGFRPEDRMAFARTLGRFHAMPAASFPEVRRSRFDGDIPAWIETWQRIAAMATAGELGELILAWCRETDPPWDRFASYVRGAAAAADESTRGMVHRDLSPQNTGWRADRRELLLFDVPQMAHGCLAHDLIELFPEDQPLDPAVADAYLEVLRERGGPALGVAELRRELDLIRPLKRIGFLGWSLWICISGRVDWTDDIEEGRRAYRAGMLENLRAIVRAMTADRALAAGGR
jgi:hypothetical protein